MKWSLITSIHSYQPFNQPTAHLVYFQRVHTKIQLKFNVHLESYKRGIQVLSHLCELARVEPCDFQIQEISFCYARFSKILLKFTQWLLSQTYNWFCCLRLRIHSVTMVDFKVSFVIHIFLDSLKLCGIKDCNKKLLYISWGYVWVLNEYRLFLKDLVDIGSSGIHMTIISCIEVSVFMVITLEQNSITFSSVINRN